MSYSYVWSCCWTNEIACQRPTTHVKCMSIFPEQGVKSAYVGLHKMVGLLPKEHVTVDMSSCSTQGWQQWPHTVCMSLPMWTHVAKPFLCTGLATRSSEAYPNAISFAWVGLCKMRLQLWINVIRCLKCSGIVVGGGRCEWIITDINDTCYIYLSIYIDYSTFICIWIIHVVDRHFHHAATLSIISPVERYLSKSTVGIFRTTVFKSWDIFWVTEQFPTNLRFAMTQLRLVFWIFEFVRTGLQCSKHKSWQLAQLTKLCNFEIGKQFVVPIISTWSKLWLLPSYYYTSVNIISIESFIL